MKLKIFNSDKSRVRFNFDFEQTYWRLRSASNIYGKNIGCVVGSDGDILSLHRASSLTYILPACSI